MLTMTRTDDTQSLLAGIGLFQGLTPEQLLRVGRSVHRRVFPEGTNIFTTEQPGEALYFILTGKVKVFIEQRDGTDVTLSILGRGDTFGEMSMVDDVGRSASAITIEESILLWMDKLAFQEYLADMPPLWHNLVRILSARVRFADEHIQSLARLDVYGRVAHQLLNFADRYGQPAVDGQVFIPLRLSQGDLADLVGASRKRVNQVIVAFKSQGLIAVDEDGRFSILDRAALERFCR
jgi:CRP/FNR family transcriptional regulator, cyclic AMP receptor protein